MTAPRIVRVLATEIETRPRMKRNRRLLADI